MNFVILNNMFFFCLQKTSVAASSTIYQLSQNPDKQEILFKEIKASLPDKNTPFNINMLERMPYLRACIKETLRYILLSFKCILFCFVSFMFYDIICYNIFRMYPVVIGNGRNLQSDAVIFGYHVPKGVSIEKQNILINSNFLSLIIDSRHFPTFSRI